MNAERVYKMLLKQEKNAKTTLLWLEGKRPSADKVMNPEEVDEATAEWLEMYNHYVNRLKEIHEAMEEVEAELPDPNECHVHQLLGNGSGLCATASCYSVPIGGNGCPHCLRDQFNLGS